MVGSCNGSKFVINRREKNEKMKRYIPLIISAFFLVSSVIGEPLGFDTNEPTNKKQETKSLTHKKAQAKKTVKAKQSSGFKMSAEITSFPWTEGFENGGSIPAEWSQVYVSGDNIDWAYISGNGINNPASANTGSYNACLRDTERRADQTKLISPALNFSSALSAELTFYLHMDKDGRRTDALKIYYKTSAGGSWTLLKSYTRRERNWRQKTISLPNISSEYYIAFEGNAKDGHGVCIDDVEVTIVAAPTPPTPITSFPWTEDFEDAGAAPSDWTETVVSGSANWAYYAGNDDSNPSTAHTGSYNACLRDYDSGTDKSKLITPPLDFTGISAATLTFWYYNELWPNDQDEFKIFYKTSSTGTWTQIGSIYNNSISEWTEVQLDLPNLSSDYYIAFEGNALYGYGVCIDDVTVAGLEAPVVYFDANNVNPEIGESVQFTDASTNDPTSWTWSFSPNTITYVSGNSNSQNPIVSFNAAGTYEVTLSATNATGTTTETKSNYIYISDGSFYPNAVQFNGVDEYVSIDNSSSLNTGGPYADRTIEAWFYCEDVSNSSKKQVIFEEGDDSRGFNIYIYNGNLYVGGWNDDVAESNWSGTWLSTALVFSKTWHHIALRLEGGTDTPTAGSFTGILDGIEFDTGDGAKVYAHTGGTNIGRTANTKFHDGTDNSTVTYFEGIIDELRIWNEARSIEEIRGNMYRQLSSDIIASSSNLAAYFTMDHADGTNLRDFAGNLNDGTLNNMSNSNWITSTVLYDFRQSLDFDGVDDYVSLGKSNKLQLTNAITLEAWVYPRSISQWGAVFSNLQNNGTSESGYGMVLDGDSEEIVWWLQTVGGTADDDANYPRFTPTLDTWQHIACTYNGSEMKLYVDGILVESKTRNGDIDWSNLPIEARIGSYIDDDENYYFDGQIDDIRIWKRALTANQIAESMTNHLWGTEDNLIAYYRFDQLNEGDQNVLYNIKGDYSSNSHSENFDTYSVDTYVSTIDGWETWSGGSGTSEDAKIKSIEAYSSLYSMQIQNSNDIIYKCGDLTTGIHSVKFEIYVPSGNSGYLNMEHFDAPGTEWAVDIFFDDAGNGSVNAEGTTDAATFSFSNDAWLSVEIVVNLDDDIASFYLNSSLIHSWQWSIDNGNGRSGTNQLGCIDFYANSFDGTTPLYYVDDFSVTQIDADVINGLLVNMDPTSDWEDAVNTNLWTGLSNTDWAVSTNWLNGGVPISTDVVRIDRTETGYYPILTSDQAVDKLTIADGASLEIQLNKQFDISTSLINYGSITVDGVMNVSGMLINYQDFYLSGEMTVGGKLINNGDFNILSDENVTGSLIDNGEVSGYGDFSVQRYMSSTEKWHLISSPVSNAYSEVFLDRYLMSYNESNDSWNNILLSDVRLRQMVGYATITNSSSSSNDTYVFEGDINTGNYTYTLSHSGTSGDNQNFNLIGNPYPSSIDWETVSIPADMDNAIYSLKPDGQYAYYANRISINGGTQMIAPGQGFWVHVKSGTASSSSVNLTFDNSCRSHVFKDEFYKSSTGAENEYQFSMFASNGKISDETVLIFNNATMPQFDSDYDAIKFLAYERNIPNIYFIGADDERLAIDNRPQTPTIGVGFSMNESTRGVTINVKEAPNFATIILEDLFTGEKTDLLKDTYTFDYATTDAANRFKLHFSFLGTDDIDTENNNLQIYSSKSDLIINSPDGLNNPTVLLYDIQGRKVLETALGFTTLKRIPLNLEAGTYIVKLIMQEGVISEKVYLQ